MKHTALFIKQDTSLKLRHVKNSKISEKMKIKQHVLLLSVKVKYKEFDGRLLGAFANRCCLKISHSRLHTLGFHNGKKGHNS